MSVAFAPVNSPLEAVSPEVDPAIEAAFRAGYGMGGDAYSNERRYKPFLIEDEALASWASQRK